MQKKLHSRKIFTMKQWCEKNGYPGVTNECLLSATGSENEEVRDMAKKARMVNIIDKGKKNGQ